MERNIFGNLQYFTFQHLDQTNAVIHCFSSRLGGVSSGDYASLNLARRGTDTLANVQKNYHILCRQLGIEKENMVMGAQVHGSRVHAVQVADKGKNIFHQNVIDQTDALITNEKGIPLVTFHADCLPIFLFDIKEKAIGLVHSGWRGTCEKIAVQTVEEMKKNYGSRPENILAGIGPSIGVCCFEVDEPVVKAFTQAIPFSQQFSRQEGEKYKIDLQNINQKLLEEAGLKTENIETAHICTKCNEDLFFSHRRSGDSRGSMAAVFCL